MNGRTRLTAGPFLEGLSITARSRPKQPLCGKLAKKQASRVRNLKQFHAYSDPKRDPRHHTVTVVFCGTGHGEPKAADDASNLKIFSLSDLPENLAFDHALILSDYSESIKSRV